MIFYSGDSSNRRDKRKGLKRAIKDEEKRLKKKNTNKHVKKKWRRLHDGGIAYGDKFKIGRGGLAAMGIIGAAAVYFALAFSSVDYTEEKGMCANPFCEWLDVLTGADEYGARQTPREQVPLEDRDFLPPEMLLPYAYGLSLQEELASQEKARQGGQDETPEDKNQAVQDMKSEVKRLKDLIKKLEADLREYDTEMATLKLEINKNTKFLDEAERALKDFRREVRNDLDSARTDEEQAAAEAKDDQYRRMLDAYVKQENSLELDKNRYAMLSDFVKKAEEDLDFAEIDLEIALDELARVKVEANRSHRENQFISIVLSETCKRIIDYGMNEKERAFIDENNWVYKTETYNQCPTYRELRDTFDNTVPIVSGQWVEGENDIYREPSKYTDYWRWYKSLPNWTIISVDPDAEMLQRSAVIEIQANEFSYVENIGSKDKSYSYTPSNPFNGTAATYSAWDNVKISQHCGHAMVAPDMVLIAEVLSYMMENCQSEDEPEYKRTITIPHLPQSLGDSEYWKYITWLRNAMETCLGKC